MTFSNFKSKKLNILAKINYPGRILGCLLMGLIICAVLYEGEFFSSWIFVVFHGLFWPHISYGLCKVSKDSKKAELNNLLIDSFFIGLWIPILSFQIIPLGMLIIAVCADNAFSGGFKLFIKGALSIIFGAITGLLLLGDLEITFESSLIVEFISVINIAIYLSVLGLQGNRQSNLLIKVRGQLMEAKNTAEMAKKKAEQATEESQKALEETRAKEQEIAHINQVVQAVNSTLDFDEVMTTVMHVLQDVFNFDQIGIFLKDEQGKNLYLAKYYGKSLTEESIAVIRQLYFQLEKDFSYVSRTFLKKKPYYISPVTSDLLKYFSPTDKELYEVNPVKAYFLAPLFVQNQVIGAIIFSDTKEAFILSDKQIDTIQLYVSQIATAINNARLAEETQLSFQEAKAKEQEIAHINQVVQIVNSTLDLDEVTAAVTEALKEIFEFHHMSIQLLDEYTSELVFIKTYGTELTPNQLQAVKNIRIPLSEKKSVFVAPFLKNKPIYLPKITSNLIPLMTPSDKAIYDLMPARAYLFLPLEVQNRIIGVIGFGNSKGYFDLDPKDILKIEQFVSQIATAINNARLYNDLNKTRKEAEAATRSKSDFLATMSHEIRTPMNSILGMTDLLSETSLSYEQNDFVETISASGELLLSVINDILDFSKIESGQIELEKTVFDLTDLAETSGKILSVKAQEKGLDLSCGVALNVNPFRIGDPTRLRQIFINLLGNSIKFTHQGAVALEVVNSDDPESLEFCVRDTGIGIPSDKQQSIFDSFSQVDTSTTRKFGGTGLGLTICKRLVELMGGRIWIESEEGKGTRFTFTARLPETDQMPESAILAPIDLKSVRKAKEIILPPLRLLLAEDVANNRKIFKLYLKNHPVSLDFAENGKIAVKKYSENRYDMVLMDVEMPEMDGYTATRSIRAFEKDNKLDETPVVALTAHAFQEYKQKCLDAGCNGYLTKPIKKNVLIEKIIEFTSSEPSMNQHIVKVNPGPDETIDARPEPDNESIARINAELEELIPDFMTQAIDDLKVISKALSDRDGDTLRRVGHSLKGSAMMYELTHLGKMGMTIEEAAKIEDFKEIEDALGKLKHYLENLQIEYV